MYGLIGLRAWGLAFRIFKGFSCKGFGVCGSGLRCFGFVSEGSGFNRFRIHGSTV